MALGKVPEPVSGNEKEVSAAVGNQPSRGRHLPELCTDSPVALLYVRRGDVDAGKGVLHLEHSHQGADVYLVSHMELYGVRVCQGFLLGGTNDDATLLEVNFVHDFC